MWMIPSRMSVHTYIRKYILVITIWNFVDFMDAILLFFQVHGRECIFVLIQGVFLQFYGMIKNDSSVESCLLKKYVSK